MWLLSTDRAELHFFASPESVPSPGYAIVSHVWDHEDEVQTFDHLQALRTSCALSPGSSSTPRARVSEKIRRCCSLAHDQGYAWLWIDACCIDKSSSAELSEAINSMFRYYALADVCYVCLRDVPSRAEGAFAASFGTGSSPFRDSRWHRRGWTLQELLAPSVVIFLSESWDSLGSKAELARELEEATGIPQAVLRLETKLSDVSVAQRMSWAAFRQTKIVEDEAYCLMGIFDVNMPTLYGEGRRAFQRLQEEIMKRNTDTTLFAWGRLFDFAQLERNDSFAPCGLFATSPLPFRGCAGLAHQAQADVLKSHPPLSRQVGGGPATFAITSHGVLAHVLVGEHQGWTLADLGWLENGQPVLLALAQRLGGANGLSHPIYDIRGDRRLVRIPTTSPKQKRPFLRASAATSTSIRTTWKDIYIAHRPAPRSPDSILHASLPPIPINQCVSAPFRFPERRIENFARLVKGNLESVQNAELPWTGEPPATFTFRVSNMDSLSIQVGRCPAPMSPYPEDTDTQASKPVVPLSLMWANIQWNPRPVNGGNQSDPDPARASDHDCATDHVVDWAELKKTFVLLPDGSHRESYQFFTMAFTRCPISTAGTLILDVSAVEERFVPRTLGDDVRIIPVDDWVVYAL
ncbi:HET-domain-containing protein [Lentinus tigrinus ALCF2SS1-7]|uniref:HET-domain-containing protein n=1 Tax=Lentinus tigrinus ALCF2SS1-6 TaxID=1328759 RepID=A0A5C2RN74_9APHY|nr:HET-domain-containing protein [Lentinus tigrinus ALCF2SS1-6]RPD68301.1 HET-domain-containing protein [Lentinus tigrinus ALCF2SS1-7]